MPTDSKVYRESFSFSPTTLLSLFEIDSRFVSVNGAVYRFCSSLNGVSKPIVFNGLEYTPFPIEVTDFEINGNGGLPRPKIRGSNIRGFLSQFLLTQDDMAGARFTRTRVHARFIDDVNWPDGINPYGTADASAAYDPDIFYVLRKSKENPEMVELECCSPFEMNNVKVPARPVLATICSFQYRDPETCGYSGAPVCDSFGKSFTDAIVDGGYGYTLTDQGVWNSSSVYAVGDWVTIASQNDFTYGATLVYVCTVVGTSGAFNNPQFNQERWIADACPHNLLGCKLHYPSTPLRISAFPGVARAPYSER